jgi:hypothetical protein
MTAGEALQIKLLLQVKIFGYDSKGRCLYGNRLVSTDNCEIQESHIDWKGADFFVDTTQEMPHCLSLSCEF